MTKTKQIQIWGVVSAVAALRCGAPPESDGTADDPSFELGAANQALRARRPQPAAPPAAATVLRTTADGETIRVIVPTLAPFVEVPVGAKCGFVDSKGVLQSCQPGTFCLSPGETAPGVCQAGPVAPRSEG